MRIRTVILRTESFDYFMPKQQPFEIIHDFRQKNSATLKETVFQESLKKHKNITKNKSFKQKIQARPKQNNCFDLHDENYLKIMKDESTRSLITMESMKWINKDSGERVSLFEEKFTSFEFPDDEGSLQIAEQ